MICGYQGPIISTNQKPTIYRNLYENTGSGDVQSANTNTAMADRFTRLREHLHEQRQTAVIAYFAK